MTIAMPSGLSRRGKKALTYAAFAGLAMTVNLSAQWAVLHMFMPGLPLLLRPVLITAAMGLGTAAGLVLKYLLDKRFIFRDESKGARAHAKRFSLYAAGGLITTAIPYAMELVAGSLKPHGPTVLIAGAVGLMIGYVIKYRLDRRFVFNRP